MNILNSTAHIIKTTARNTSDGLAFLGIAMAVVYSVQMYWDVLCYFVPENEICTESTEAKI